MMFKISEAATSRSSASFKSWAKCAISDSLLGADELRRRAASAPLGRFGAAGLRRRGLADPALERPLITFLKAQETHRSGSNRQVRSGRLAPRQCPLWVTTGHNDGPTSCPLIPQKQTFASAAG